MPEFNPDIELGASLAAKWETWLSDFEIFLITSGITDETCQQASLLYQAGSRVREILTLIPNTGNAGDFSSAKEKLTSYFEPQKNRRYDVYTFCEARQNHGETLDQFHTHLRTLSQACEFTDVDFEIEQQFITGGISSNIRKKALREPKYDLFQVLMDGRRDEMS